MILSGSDEDSVLLGEAEVESLELIVDGELNSEQHDEGDEEPGDGLGLGLFVGGHCAVPLIEIRCASNLLRYNSACGGGSKMGL